MRGKNIRLCSIKPKLFALGQKKPPAIEAGGALFSVYSIKIHCKQN